MATKKDLLLLVKGEKATGVHAPDLFKGYTKLSAEQLETLLEVLAPAAETPEFAPVRVEPKAPEAIQEAPTGRQGRPAAVQVKETFTGKFRGNPARRFLRGTLFRGETAWELWDTHRGHLNAKE